MNFHEIWYEHNATRGYPTLFLFSCHLLIPLWELGFDISGPEVYVVDL